MSMSKKDHTWWVALKMFTASASNKEHIIRKMKAHEILLWRIVLAFSKFSIIVSALQSVLRVA